jgi:hypothetical protein
MWTLRAVLNFPYGEKNVTATNLAMDFMIAQGMPISGQQH